jgi:hypothetical protein
MATARLQRSGSLTHSVLAALGLRGFGMGVMGIGGMDEPRERFWGKGTGKSGGATKTAGAEAQILSCIYTARLKPCPFKASPKKHKSNG